MPGILYIFMPFLEWLTHEMKQRWKPRQILLPFKVPGAKQSTLCMEIEIGKLFRENIMVILLAYKVKFYFAPK